VHLKGANSIAASGLGSEMDLVDAGRAVSILLDINGVKQAISPCRAPFPVFKACYFRYNRLRFLERLNWMFVNW